MRTFNISASVGEDTDDIRVEVFHSQHTHPSMFFHQMDEDADGKKFEAVICVTATQMREIRHLIDRTLSGEFK